VFGVVKLLRFSSTVGIMSDWKVNLVGEVKFSEVFKSAEKNKIKIKKKREFLRKIDFDFWCDSETNERLYMKFSLVFYTR